MTELDWRTYANAAKKAKKFVDDNWEPDFRYMDKLAADKDLRKRNEKYLKKLDSIDKFQDMADKRYVEKYPDIKGYRSPSFMDYALKHGEGIPKHVIFNDESKFDEMIKAQDELADFYNDKAQYTKGKGWVTK